MHSPQQTPLHFVGIGGIGMSGIAEVFLNQGYPVSGSDLQESETTRNLVDKGARIFYGHRAPHVQGAKVVVISSAVRADNPEVLEAHRQRIPVIPRAEMLGELMRGRVGIAIAGTHGKTTTTSLMATVLTEAGWDPTLVIGGKVDSFGGNAKLGQGQYLVAEADESDGSFLHLPATLGVITNIDNDHLDHYQTLGAIDQAFVDFVGKIPFYGLVALCGEDPGVRRILPRLSKPFQTYGFTREWDYSAEGIVVDGMGSRFRVYSQKQDTLLGTVQLHVPGQHNVLNAMAVVTLGIHLGMSFESISRGLEAFRGVKRRFEVKWRDLKNQQMIVDDYAHHPTEIKATLAAARSIWKGRIVVVFQPHRYSRTLHCMEDFSGAFGNADSVYMTDIYSAGEAPLPGVSSQVLAQKLKNATYAGDLAQAQKQVLQDFKPGDLVLCLGAGSITTLPRKLISELEKT